MSSSTSLSTSSASVASLMSATNAGCRAEATNPFLGKFLSLLGFRDDPRKPILENLNLFLHPNVPAFQTVVRFLFEVLDSTEAAKVFRDCWPVLDKKQEAEFRKNAFTWYKSLQVKNPSELPLITASLFQSPGGRKFNVFLNSFLRFVATRHILKDPWSTSAVITLTSKDDPKLLTPILSNLTSDAISEAAEYRRKWEEISKNRREMIQDLSERLRRKKLEEAEIPDVDEAELCEIREKVRNLEAQCLELRCRFEEGCRRLNLPVIDEIIRFNDRPRLDLTKINDKNFTLEEILKERFDGVLDLCQLNSPLPDSLFRTVEEVIKPVNSHVISLNKKLSDTYDELSVNTIPNIQSRINELLNQLHLKCHYQNKDFSKLLLPPTPGIRINHQSRKERKLDLNFFTTINNDTEVKQDSTAKNVSALFSTTYNEQPLNNNPVSSVMSSTLEYSVDRLGDGKTEFTTRVDTTIATTVTFEGSKCSVFSPILSSSHMEPSSSVNGPSMSSSSPTSSKLCNKFRANSETLKTAWDENPFRATSLFTEHPSQNPFIPYKLSSIRTPKTGSSLGSSFRISMIEAPEFHDISGESSTFIEHPNDQETEGGDPSTIETPKTGSSLTSPFRISMIETPDFQDISRNFSSSSPGIQKSTTVPEVSAKFSLPLIKTPEDKPSKPPLVEIKNTNFSLFQSPKSKPARFALSKEILMTSPNISFSPTPTLWPNDELSEKEGTEMPTDERSNPV